MVDRVIRQGRRLRGRHLTVVVVETDGEGIAVGVSTSTKLSKRAVDRNRMRRRCREALRVLVREEPEQIRRGLQLLLLPHTSSLTCAFSDLRRDLRTLLT